MEDYKNDIKNVYREAASLNLYVTICNANRERVLTELLHISELVEKVIKKLEA